MVIRDVVKWRILRWECLRLIEWVLKPMTSLMRRGDTDAEGKSHLKMDTEMRFMLPAAQGLPGEARKCSFLLLLKNIQPWRHFDLDSWSPELGENKCLLF